MSQKSVEVLLGKLATDEEMRHRFRRDPQEVLETLRGAGWEVSAVEADALRSLDMAPFERLARSLDPRLQKASLHETPKET